MTEVFLEHVNVTVPDPDKTAKMLCDLFGWKIRWQGDAIHGGRTIHVGGEASYVAIYTGNESHKSVHNSYETVGGLNHIGVVVDDVDAIERLVTERGFEPHSHADYEPGKRFYFYDHDGIEFEVVSYNA
jgi:catechol 2,3-dioxygenase-like lactoylglutathione lyase family enzyme